MSTKQPIIGALVYRGSIPTTSWSLLPLGHVAAYDFFLKLFYVFGVIVDSNI